MSSSAPQFSQSNSVFLSSLSLSQQRILVMKSSHISRASYQERFPCSVLNSSLNTFKYPSKSCITPHHQPTTTTTTTTNGIQIQNSTLFPHPFPLHSHPPCRNSWNLHSSATPSWHNQHFLLLKAQMAPFIHPTNHFL